MPHKTLMIQGTSSDAGKSLAVTALCRVFANKGFKVAPFKPQNMALNSAVTPCGGEIGRAQAVQAQAANVAISVDFNPILLKPQSDTGAQVIIHGKAISAMEAAAYHDYKAVAMQAVLESHQRLTQAYDVIVVEGAGSPAEINLRKGDIANMGFANAVDCPVILIADIDRGGVFAQLVGTLALLSEEEQNRVVGFIINKFRGDISLLQTGLDWLEERTNKPVLGVLPFLTGLDIAAEDAININNVNDNAQVTIAVLVLPRICNHTDFDPLRLHPDINLIYVAPHKAIPTCELIIIPGSKQVRADLNHLIEQGWHQQIAKHLRYGGKLLGICGGYQMLGKTISDNLGLEGTRGQSNGLNYLPLTTHLQTNKQLTNTKASLCFDNKKIAIKGYEIHAGQSQLHDQYVPWIVTEQGKVIGCTSCDNQVAGTYLHGLFDVDHSITALLHWLGHDASPFINYAEQQEQAITRLANEFSQHIDIERLLTFIPEVSHDK